MIIDCRLEQKRYTVNSDYSVNPWINYTASQLRIEVAVKFKTTAIYSTHCLSPKWDVQTPTNMNINVKTR